MNKCKSHVLLIYNWHPTLKLHFGCYFKIIYFPIPKRLKYHLSIYDLVVMLWPNDNLCMVSNTRYQKITTSTLKHRRCLPDLYFTSFNSLEHNKLLIKSIYQKWKRLLNEDVFMTHC